MNYNILENTNNLQNIIILLCCLILFLLLNKKSSSQKQCIVSSSLPIKYKEYFTDITYPYICDFTNRQNTSIILKNTQFIGFKSIIILQNPTISNKYIIAICFTRVTRGYVSDGNPNDTNNNSHRINCLLIGGGGGGGGGNINGNSGPGGGSGANITVSYIAQTPRYIINVGAGGLGGDNNTNGNNGGNTVITNNNRITLVQALGGNGGKMSSGDGGANPGAGGVMPNINSSNISNIQFKKNGGSGYSSSFMSGEEGFLISKLSSSYISLSRILPIYYKTYNTEQYNETQDLSFICGGGSGGDANSGGYAASFKGGGINYNNLNNMSGTNCMITGGGGGGCAGDCRNPNLRSLKGGNGGDGLCILWFNQGTLDEVNSIKTYFET
jgi:hypothetical protein